MQYFDIEKNYKKAFILCLLVNAGVKIVLMMLFSSDYQNIMFIPFVKSFLEGSNPYELFYENGYISSFPYPPIMLFVESIGGGLLKLCGDVPVYIQNFLFKSPLLLMDYLGFLYIWRICKQRFKYVLVLYTFSPVILYSVFMHGQLDIIPTTFLIMAIYYLISPWKNTNLVWFTIFLSLALNCKFHIVAIFPILFWYLFQKRGWKECFLSVFGVVLCTISVIGIFLGNGFIETVLFNKEQTAITKVFLNYGDVKIIVPILVVSIIYLNVFQLNYINKDLLLSFCGITFAVFLVCVRPMPGWFVWIVPFIAVYFVLNNKNKYKLLFTYFVFNVIYILYFVFLHKTQFVDLYFMKFSLQSWKIDSEVLKNSIYTILVAILLMLSFEMYQFGVSSNSLYKRKNLPFTIGIAGDSGTGKSLMIVKLEKMLGVKRMLYIEGDGDHKWERKDDNWKKYTHLNPKSNYLYRQAEDIQTLREGSAVKRINYDHETGKFTRLKRIMPKPYIVLCGLHALYLPQTRNVLDLKIYMDTDEELRRYWKIKRDTGKRGYSQKEITKQLDERLPDAEKYIYPQKGYADICIKYYDDEISKKSKKDKLDLKLKLTINAMADFENVINDLAEMTDIEWEYAAKQNKQIVIVKSWNDALDLEHIAHKNIPQFDEMFPQQITWETGIDGIVQLFILIMISKKMRGM